MKLLIVFLTLISINCFAVTNSSTVSLRFAQQPNGEAIVNTYAISSPTATYRVATSAAFDPFISKTNKYAESKVISIIAQGSAIVKFGASDVSDPTSSSNDFYIATGTQSNFLIDTTYPYVRILPLGNIVVYTTELY